MRQKVEAGGSLELRHLVSALCLSNLARVELIKPFPQDRLDSTRGRLGQEEGEFRANLGLSQKIQI